MEHVGVIPAHGRLTDAGPTGALRPVLGVPLVLWAAHTLLRAIPAERVVVVTPDEEVAAVAERRGLRAVSEDSPLDSGLMVVADPDRPFCLPMSLKLAVESGAGEIAPFQTSVLERMRAESEEEYEVLRATARGLSPGHPCVAGVRSLALGLPLGKRVRAVVSDVDGVLTDGRTFFGTDEGEGKLFHMHDGMGVRLLGEAGIKVGWLSSAQDTGVVRRRGAWLGVDAVDVGVGDKGPRFAKLCAELGVEAGDVLYIGDDVNDLPAFALAGCCASPADGRAEVRSRADLVLRSCGGRGAFREAADIVLDGIRADGDG